MIMIVNTTPIIAKNPIGIASFLICPIFNLRPDSKIKIGIITNSIISGSPSMKLYNSSTSKPIIGAGCQYCPKEHQKGYTGYDKVSSVSTYCRDDN